MDGLLQERRAPGHTPNRKGPFCQAGPFQRLAIPFSCGQRLRPKSGHRARLIQGYVAEAQEAFADLLNVSEQNNGPDHWHSLVYRYNLALATVYIGDAAKAKTIVDALPADLSNRSDWPPRHAARLAYARGRIADALGDRTMGTGYLTAARAFYVANSPPDLFDRKLLEDYIAQRGGLEDA